MSARGCADISAKVLRRVPVAGEGSPGEWWCHGSGADFWCRYGDGVRFAAREELIVDNAKLRQLFKAAVGTGQPKRHRVMSSTESFGTTLDPWFDLMEASTPLQRLRPRLHRQPIPRRTSHDPLRI